MDLSDLNEEQRQAVTHGEGPLLVVAGAGTGKTQVITRRVAYLIESGQARPDQILALTFTDKAASEMQERLDVLLPYGILEARVMTFHAFGDSLLQDYGLEIGLEPGSQVMTQPQQIVFLRQHIDELPLEYYLPVGNPDQYLQALTTYFSRLKEELVSPERYLDLSEEMLKQADDDATKLEAQKNLELAKSFQVYIELSRKAGKIDFADQVSLAIELLERRPNVLAEVKLKIKYILVDEFQDTNFAQNRLLELIGGADGNITVVGDDDQSIYKFRGASISNIMGFVESFHNVKQVVLRQNYRSSQEILDAAYRLIRHNDPDRLEVRNHIDKYLIARSSGPTPILLSTETYSMEADLIAKSIKQRLDNGAAGNSIAVLVRKGSQAELINQALAAQQIPYRYSGRQSLYQQPEVRELLNFLQYITDPNDSVSLYHLLAGEVFKMPLQKLMELAGVARRRNESMEKVIKDTEFTDEKLADFNKKADKLRELSRSFTVGQLCYAFLDSTGYLHDLTVASKIDPRAETKIHNLAAFFKLLSDFEQVADDKSAMGYILVSSVLRQAGDAPEASDITETGEVQVMTVHKAKGLEFETVYLFDLTQGAFPANRRAETIAVPEALVREESLPTGNRHIQEERRLMYVAMTRAKSNLVITFSPDHGGARAKKPSRFIAEALGVEPPKLPGRAVETALEQIALFNNTDRPSVGRHRFEREGKLFLTPHQIDDYLSCPENFHYNYILEVPKPAQPGLMYGKVIHQIINQYYLWRKRKKVELPQLLAMIDRLWENEGFVSKGQEARRRQMAEDTVRRFCRREEAVSKLPKWTEKEFSVELQELNVVISGRFDAVYEDEDGVEIRDFKTSMVEEATKADDKADKSVQLAVYALAWQRMKGELPKSMVLDFVETGAIGKTVPTAESLKKTLEQVKQVADGIRQGDFRPGKNCFYCDHQKVGQDVTA